MDGTVTAPGLEAAGWSEQGRRRENQDRLGMVRQDRGLALVVADGMGGHADGALAATLAVEAASGTLEVEEALDADGLRRAVAAANAAIGARSRVSAARPSMGTTLVVATVRDGSLTVAHAGDSRAYLVRDGVATALTEDHSWVAERVREGRLTAAEALAHPARSVITRCLMGPPVEPDVTGSPLQRGDAVVLCTDGVWEAVDGTALAACVAEASDAASAARSLCDRALAAGSLDNVTAVVCRVTT